MTAWELYRETNKKYKSKFTDWLYSEFVNEVKTLDMVHRGVIWLHSKPEQEAIEIMNRFVKEHEK